MGFLFKSISVLLALCAVVGYDVSTHGSLESSHTGRYLREAGLLIYVKPYYSCVEYQALSAYKYCKKNFPYKAFGTVKNYSIQYTDNTLIFFKAGVDNSIRFAEFAKNEITDTLPAEIVETVNKYKKSSGQWIDENVYPIFKGILDWFQTNVLEYDYSSKNIQNTLVNVRGKAKVYYNDVSGWVSRKVNCLLSA